MNYEYLRRIPSVAVVDSVEVLVEADVVVGSVKVLAEVRVVVGSVKVPAEVRVVVNFGVEFGKDGLVSKIRQVMTIDISIIARIAKLNGIFHFVPANQDFVSWFSSRGTIATASS